ncbi:hypothetical protein B0H19DRAFT_1260549 [Mycena capillaripes]|nr:hypothetical protein B0H19DRAFT_1260549 [Mycena capillaripes]
MRFRLSLPTRPISSRVFSRALSPSFAMTRNRLATVSKSSETEKISNYWTQPRKLPPCGQLHAVVAASFPTFPEDLLPYCFSCKWNRWTRVRFFFVRPEWYDLSPAEAIFNHGFKVPGRPRPLAFCDGPDTIVFVAVGNEYYLWDGDFMKLHRYGSKFSSDEDFLVRMKPMWAMEDLGVVECYD